MSSSIKWVGGLVIVGAIGILFSVFADKGSEAKLSYHSSLWNNVAPEIERALGEKDHRKSVGLSHVYGVMLPHHIPATIPELVDFYVRLKETQDVKNFIVVGPDHNDSGAFPVTVSNIPFFTVYGEVEPVYGVPDRFSKDRIAFIEEMPFEDEHSIGSHMLLICRIFPGARVTPIILRSNVSKDQAESLGKAIAELLDEETVLIGSVDFSHYLETDQAMPIDERSGNVLQNLDIDSVHLVNADSGKSVATFIQAMIDKGASDTDSFKVLNTNHFMENTDYTTGYVFGFWGIK